MEEKTETSSGTGTSSTVPESPRPTAFTIAFGEEKKVDLQRHKSLAEKFQQRHKRGKSMSKLESSTVAAPATTTSKKHPLTGNLPRKSSFQSEGYYSSDERTERCRSANLVAAGGIGRRSDLTLPLENVTSDRMTHSFPSAALMSMTSPFDLQNVSSPEFELISPFSPNVSEMIKTINDISLSSEEASDREVNVNSQDVDMDRKSDTASEAGTYTLEVDNYSEEQKARMSIDREFKIEKLSVEEKTEEYIRSLSQQGQFVAEDIISSSLSSQSQMSASSSTVSSLQSSFSAAYQQQPATPTLKSFGGDGRHLESLLRCPNTADLSCAATAKKLLSPILSPTQNLSIVEDCRASPVRLTSPSSQSPVHHVPSTKTLKPQLSSDEGTIISVTSSGAFRSQAEERQRMERRLSLTRSEVHVEAYVDGKMYNEEKLNNNSVKASSNRKSKLTANLVNVQSIEVTPNNSAESGSIVSASLIFGKMGNVATVTTAGLPPPTSSPTGKTSPSKIPSPIHTLCRPRSRNSLSAMPDDFDTDLMLKPTRNYINSLQQKLSQDNSDLDDSDYDVKYGLQLNNTAHLLKQRALHTRHNSLDDNKAINNKLEHFQNKNLQPIDQTYTNVFNQYPNKQHNKVVNKINNSPSNSPVRRSNSFSNRMNQMNNVVKSTNIVVTTHHLQAMKDSNLGSGGGGGRGSPAMNKNGGAGDRIQRSSSTACIQPGYVTNRRPSVTEHKKIDRSQFGDTESSSEEDLDPGVQKKKDLGNLSNTRCNRTFSLRRARVDIEAGKPKCPNTPDMRRKTFQPVGVKPERAISVDRKPVKTNEVQSRYLLSLNKRASSMAKESSSPKPVTKPSVPVTAKPVPAKPANAFARAEGGRFSMRTQKSTIPAAGPTKVAKKDGKNMKQQGSGARSNSSLSSREVEFQNWKRRKSYDPMKAAAEGKRKEIEKKHGGISAVVRKPGATSPDSSPSHSGSVHRSQSFHGTAALEQLISSEEDDDITFSADEGFSPPTPSPCELSPTKASLRHNLWDRIRH